MTTVSPRRRRVLFFAQMAAGLLGAIIISVLLDRDQRPVLGPAVVASVVVGVALGWGLEALERAKFHSEVPVVSDTDWARELWEVRNSRQVIVSAFEIERRRIERDLHDGAQQHLVAATMKLGEASLILEQHATAMPPQLSGLASLLENAHRDAEESMRTLRATVNGIHPQLLTDLGLLAAVTDMVERSHVDAVVRCPNRLPEMPEGVSAAAWFFCSEALTNIAKHAPGAEATILLGADRELHVSVMDNGPGGAWLREGGGLLGMRERLAAFGGEMQLSSPQGGPTTLSARIPLLLEPVNAGRLA